MTTREVRIPPSLRVHNPAPEEETHPRRPRPCRMSDQLLAAIAKADATYQAYIQKAQAAENFEYTSKEARARRDAYDEYLKSLTELHGICVIERSMNR
jgi:hypothetical protein